MTAVYLWKINVAINKLKILLHHRRFIVCLLYPKLNIFWADKQVYGNNFPPQKTSFLSYYNMLQNNEIRVFV